MSSSADYTTPQEIYEQRLNYDWEKNLAVWHNSHEMFLHDHLGGLEKDFQNEMLCKIPPGVTVRTEYLLTQKIKDQYPTLDLRFDARMMIFNNHFVKFKNRTVSKFHPIENFLCSFFRRSYPGRIWLLCWLHEIGWFDFNYGSKDFVIEQYPDEIKQLYLSKIGNDFDDPDKQRSRCLMQSATKLVGSQVHDHSVNIDLISEQIQKSFVCIVAETHPTHYYPFPTEKFLYPIVNSTLWVAYAQPGYHNFISKYLGFRLYDCFDYQFDSVEDHIERIAMITDMLKRFSTMNQAQWNQIYQTQKEIIDYNVNHVKSGNFIRFLSQFDEVA
jgi:hypothetical protein